MNFVKLFVSLMILFVAVNLLLTIYRLLNRKWREGLENADDEQLGTRADDKCGPGSNCFPAAKSGSDSVNTFREWQEKNAAAAAAAAAAPAAPAPAAPAAPAPAPAPAPAATPAKKKAAPAPAPAPAPPAPAPPAPAPAPAPPPSPPP